MVLHTSFLKGTHSMSRMLNLHVLPKVAWYCGGTNIIAQKSLQYCKCAHVIYCNWWPWLVHYTYRSFYLTKSTPLNSLASNQTTSSAECNHPKKEGRGVQKRHIYSPRCLLQISSQHRTKQIQDFIPVQEIHVSCWGIQCLYTPTISSSNSRAASVKI